MDKTIEPAPACADQFEYGLELAGYGDVERGSDRRTELLCERFDVRPSLVVEPGDRELRASGAECLRAAIGDRVLVGDTDDERLVAGEHGADLVGHGAPSAGGGGGAGAARGSDKH